MLGKGGMEPDTDANTEEAMDIQTDNRGVNMRIDVDSARIAPDEVAAVQGDRDTVFSRVLRDMSPHEETTLRFLLAVLGKERISRMEPPVDMLKEALAISDNYYLLHREFQMSKPEAFKKYRRATLEKDSQFSVKVDLSRKQLFLVAENLTRAETFDIVAKLCQVKSPVQGNQLEYIFEKLIEQKKVSGLKEELGKILIDMKMPNLYKVLEDPGDKFYPMNMENVGKCIIINQKIYKTGLENRQGTDLDCARLYETFSMAGYEVQVYNNVKISQIKDNLMENVQKMEESCSSLVVCVLAHGDKDIFYCTEGKGYEISKLKECFSATKCKALAGKPKMFFIVACQGKETLAASPSITPSSREEVSSDNTSKPFTGKYADDHKDFFTFFSSVPGTTSLRHLREGTFFVKALCSSLQRQTIQLEGLDIFDVQTNVPVLLEGMSAVIQGQSCSMVPQAITTLNKNVKFRAKTEWAKEALKLRLDRVLVMICVEKMIKKLVLKELNKYS